MKNDENPPIGRIFIVFVRKIIYYIDSIGVQLRKLKEMES